MLASNLRTLPLLLTNSEPSAPSPERGDISRRASSLWQKSEKRQSREGGRKTKGELERAGCELVVLG